MKSQFGNCGSKSFILKGWFTIIGKVCMVLLHRNIKLSVIKLFVILLGDENGTNLKKPGIVIWKSIFEVLYLLNNALKYTHPA